MDTVRNIVIGGVATIFIGGAAITFSQEDFINNFATDTGFTQEQAEEYINNVSEDELTTLEAVGSRYLVESEETQILVNSIDCINYMYEWESPTLSCQSGKSQLQKIANSEQAVGQAYLELGSKDASEEEMRKAIQSLDQLNSDYRLPIAQAVFETEVIEEFILTNSYNKSLLKTALESI